MTEPTSGEMLETLLDTLFIGEERLSVAELRRRAMAEDMPSDVHLSIGALPEGEYTQDEVLDALHTHAVITPPSS